MASARWVAGDVCVWWAMLAHLRSLGERFRGYGPARRAAADCGAKRALPWRQPIPPTMRMLESRLMFDGAAGATLAEVGAGGGVSNWHDAAGVSPETTSLIAALTSLATPVAGNSDEHPPESQVPMVPTTDVLRSPPSSGREVVAITTDVPQWTRIAASLSSNYDLVVIDANRDGLSQLSEAMRGLHDVDAVHIISHGSAGSLQFGNSDLTSTSLDARSADLNVIGASLGRDADILLYGCDVASGSAGASFVGKLSQMTGADVAGSIDGTGSALLGGNWVLEHAVGEITESALAFQSWDYLLAVGDTTRVSVATDGTQGNGQATYPSVSSDGRYVAFSSSATNLVAGDTNGVADIFLHDNQTGATTRVSVATNGTQGNSNSANPSISSDGRYVAFQSMSDTLVAGDVNAAFDVFLHDTQTGVTTRVNVATGGTETDMLQSSDSPSISADGRYVAFESDATNLVAGDTNAQRDVFLRDTQTGTTTRVSVKSDGTQGNGLSDKSTISSDGRYVAFYSAATNLVAGDTNGMQDVFLHDTQTGTTTRVSVTSGGTQGNSNSISPSISSDGRYVAFYSSATNLVAGDTNGWNDTFLHDTQTGTTTRVSVASGGTQGVGGDSHTLSISSDGRYVASISSATNLVAGDTNGVNDLFLHDTQTGTTTRISVASDGTQVSGTSYGPPSISSDGRYFAFYSSAASLVAGDTNGFDDVFVHQANAIAKTPAVSGVTTLENADTGPIAITRDTGYSSDTAFYKITAITGGTLYSDAGYTSQITGGTFLASAGATTNVYFRPTANWNSTKDGNAGFTVQASTSNADGGLGGSTVASAIAVTAVADTPSITGATADQGRINSSGLVVSRNGNDGTETAFFKITAISGGSLYKHDGISRIHDGDFITFAEGNAGLGFISSGAGNGSFKVQAATTNGDAGLGGSEVTADITVIPTPKSPVVVAPPAAPPPSPSPSPSPIAPPSDGMPPAKEAPSLAILPGNTFTRGDSLSSGLISASSSTPAASQGQGGQGGQGQGGQGQGGAAGTPVAPSTGGEGTPRQNVAQMVAALAKDGGLTRGEQQAVIGQMPTKTLVEGLKNAADPAGRAAGAILDKVASGRAQINQFEMRREMARQGVDGQTMMTYLMAFQKVEKEAFTRVVHGALQDIEANARVADAFTDSGDTPEQREARPLFDPSLGRKVAVLIGVENYGGRMPSLNTPMTDVAGLSEILRARMGYQTIILPNANRDDIVRTLKELSEQLGEDNSLMVYYAGHGYVAEKTGVGYWLPSDARTDSADKWVSTKDLSNFLSGVKAKQIMVVSDSCYSGALTREYTFTSESAGLPTEDVLARRSVTVMSSGGDEPVQDDGSEGHSVFAANLIRALKTAKPTDAGFDVFADVREGVAKTAPQTPQYGAMLSAGHAPGGDYLFQ